MLDFTVNKTLPVISGNFEDIKARLMDTISQYTGIVVTEEQLPICKQKQKELAGIRVQIDNFRKDIKKELSKPITEFEDKCKGLIELVEKAEKPLKDGIEEYDEKRRQEKAEIAKGIIQEVIKAHNINEKYAVELTVLDKYKNLTATPKDVRDDVEQRAFAVKERQNAEDEKIQVIQQTIDNANKGIKMQLTIGEFQRLMDMPTRDIISEINSRAEKIRQAENPPATQQEQPAAPQTPVQPAPPASQPKAIQWHVEFKVIDSKERIEALSAFLRNNGYDYKTLKCEKVNG